MSFRLPNEAFDRLLDKERADGRVDSTSVKHGALWLHTDLGPVYYLTRDGRVLSEDVILETPIEEAPYRAALSALILGARHLGAPELLSLLPCRSARLCSLSRNRPVEIAWRDHTTERDHLVP